MGVAVSVISMEVCMWQDRRSPLHLSLWRGHESVALCLMEQGANVNHRDEVRIFRICLFLKTVHLITLLRQFFLGHPVPCSDIDVAVSEELLLTATQHSHRFAAIIQVNLR